MVAAGDGLINSVPEHMRDQVVTSGYITEYTTVPAATTGSHHKSQTIPTKTATTAISAIFFGPPGKGKTSLCAYFDRPHFLIDSQEQGIKILSQRGLVPTPVGIDIFDVESDTSYQRIIDRMYQLAINTDIGSVVVEGLTGMERMLFNAYRSSPAWNKPDDDFFNYAQGPKAASKFSWPTFITACQAILDSGKNILVTGHTKVKEDTNPEGSKYMKYFPYCETDVWAAMHKWASLVGFITDYTEEDKQSRGLKSVAASTCNRIMYVEGTPFCEAKNWYGLHGVIQMGKSGQEAYHNLMGQINQQ